MSQRATIVADIGQPLVFDANPTVSFVWTGQENAWDKGAINIDINSYSDKPLPGTTGVSNEVHFSDMANL